MGVIEKRFGTGQFWDPGLWSAHWVLMFQHVDEIAVWVRTL